MSKCKQEENLKVIYSLKVVRRIMEKGYSPVKVMPNPLRPEFNCWAFQITDDFLLALDKVLSEVS